MQLKLDEGFQKLPTRLQAKITEKIQNILAFVKIQELAYYDGTVMFMSGYCIVAISGDFDLIQMTGTIVVKDKVTEGEKVFCYVYQNDYCEIGEVE